MIRVSDEAKAAKKKAEPKLEDTPIEELENLSDKDLKKLVRKLNDLDPDDFDEDEYEEYEEKQEEAERILKEREQKKLDEEKQILDDGTVKGLILSGDYSKIDTYVLVRNATGKQIIWEIRNGKITGLDSFSIPGVKKKPVASKKSKWKTLDADDLKTLSDSIVRSCKRRLKESDIVMCSFSNMSKGMFDDYYTLTGSIYTEDRIFILDEGRLDYIIDYAEIDNIDVDLDNDTIQFTVEGGEEVKFEVPFTASETFDLLSDIRERLNGE